MSLYLRIPLHSRLSCAWLPSGDWPCRRACSRSQRSLLMTWWISGWYWIADPVIFCQSSYLHSLIRFLPQLYYYPTSNDRRLARIGLNWQCGEFCGDSYCFPFLYLVHVRPCSVTVLNYTLTSMVQCNQKP